MKRIYPQRIKPGDTIGIISPSNTPLAKKSDFEKSRQKLEKELSIKTVLAKHALGDYWYTTGTAADRAHDIHEMFLNDKVSAIFMSGGGDTNIDLLELLDYELIKSHPKIFAGISDAATLLNPIWAKTGLVGFCGFGFLEFGKRDMKYGLESIRKTWFERSDRIISPNPDWHDFYDYPTRYKKWNCLRTGSAEGVLLGTNFGSLVQILGTEYAPDFEGSILFLEAWKSHKKRIHRYLSILKLHGVLDEISGMILGYMVGSDDPDTYGDDRDLSDLVLELTEGYDFPIMQVGEFGHYVENFIQPIGGEVRMDSELLALSIGASVE